MCYDDFRDKFKGGTDCLQIKRRIIFTTMMCFDGLGDERV